MSFGWATIVSFSICAVILLIWTMDRALLASLSVTLAVVVLIVGMLALLSGGLYVEGKRILDSIVSYLETEQIQVSLTLSLSVLASCVGFHCHSCIFLSRDA